ncbi:MAG: hypothetical protein AAGE76_06245 [Pseudomonadota bacterium]
MSQRIEYPQMTAEQAALTEAGAAIYPQVIGALKVVCALGLLSAGALTYLFYL